MTLTQQQVEDRFAEKSLELLSTYVCSTSLVQCRCRCGKIFEVNPHWVFYNGRCSCGCYDHMYQYEPGKKSYKWKGHGDISARLWHGIKNSAKLRNIDFDISIEDAWNIFVKQNRTCPLTKCKLRFNRLSKSYKGKTA